MKNTKQLKKRMALNNFFQRNPANFAKLFSTLSIINAKSGCLKYFYL